MTEPLTETAQLSVILAAPPRDLGGFTVRRALPSMRRRHVGPFVFVDEMGPFVTSATSTIAVRPHPHIGLATVTYLFDGEMTHRDSLGTKQVIFPGDVNWMTAGRGIVHSERLDRDVAARGITMHGLQCWVGLPEASEDGVPSFAHYAAATIPSVALAGAKVTVVLGSAFGVTSPVVTSSPTFFADVTLDQGNVIAIEALGTAPELAAYVVSGSVECDGAEIGAGTIFVFSDTLRPMVKATGPAPHSRVVFLGGAPRDGERFLFWNFVASSKERLEDAKRDWREQRLERFPKVPGDEVEFIPLP